MLVEEEIRKFRQNLRNAYISCRKKGAAIPDIENLNNLAETINSIVCVGGDRDVDLENIYKEEPPEEEVVEQNTTEPVIEPEPQQPIIINNDPPKESED